MLHDDLLASTAKLVELVETAGTNALQYGEFNQTKGGLPAKVRREFESCSCAIRVCKLMNDDLRPWENGH